MISEEPESNGEVEHAPSSWFVVDASDVIAALALAGIPISVVIARLQLRGPLKVERARWLADSRRATYGLFQTALAQFRRSLLASELDFQVLYDAMHDLHNAAHLVAQVGPDDVGDLAEDIMRLYQWKTRALGREIEGGRLPSPEARAEAWAAHASLRVELDKAIKRAYDSQWGN